jgi:hypothetical protein
MKSVLSCRGKPLPVGKHEAVLVSWETIPSPFNRDRDAIEFRFDGPNGELSKITGTQLRIGESLHELAEQLSGAPIQKGDTIDLGEFVGRKYEVTVGQNRTGGVAIECVKPISE